MAGVSGECQMALGHVFIHHHLNSLTAHTSVLRDLRHGHGAMFLDQPQHPPKAISFFTHRPQAHALALQALKTGSEIGDHILQCLAFG